MSQSHSDLLTRVQSHRSEGGRFELRGQCSVDRNWLLPPHTKVSRPACGAQCAQCTPWRSAGSALQLASVTAECLGSPRLRGRVGVFLSALVLSPERTTHFFPCDQEGAKRSSSPTLTRTPSPAPAAPPRDPGTPQTSDPTEPELPPVRPVPAPRPWTRLGSWRCTWACCSPSLGIYRVCSPPPSCPRRRPGEAGEPGRPRRTRTGHPGCSETCWRRRRTRKR